jgi:hypothetical protein
MRACSGHHAFFLTAGGQRFSQVVCVNGAYTYVVEGDAGADGLHTGFLGLNNQLINEPGFTAAPAACSKAISRGAVPKERGTGPLRLTMRRAAQRRRWLRQKRALS